MDEAGEWVLLMQWEIVKGAEPPLEELAGWLRVRGVDYPLPLDPYDVIIDRFSSPAPNGSQPTYLLRVRANVLRRLGLHPDQPGSSTFAPYPSLRTAYRLGWYGQGGHGEGAFRLRLRHMSLSESWRCSYNW
jgi:hypothetical protein